VEHHEISLSHKTTLLFSSQPRNTRTEYQKWMTNNCIAGIPRVKLGNSRATQLTGQPDACKALRLHVHDRYTNGVSWIGSRLKKKCVKYSRIWKAVFWVVAPCSLVEVYQRFRGPCCLQPHRPDDGGSKDLWNVGKLLPDYTALQPRRQPSSNSPSWEPQILIRWFVLNFTVKNQGAWIKRGRELREHIRYYRISWCRG
jgi:hypothetical protein